MDFSAFVGLPWKDRGRGPDGYDCWGLFIAAFRAGTCINLSSYADDYTTAIDKAEVARIFAGELGDWAEIERGRERPFDGVTMRIAGQLHIGLIVARGAMLHMPLGKSSVIERLDRYTPVLTGLYRHREFA